MLFRSEPFIVGLVAQSISSKEVGQLRLTLMDMREALDEGNAEAGMTREQSIKYAMRKGMLDNPS